MHQCNDIENRYQVSHFTTGSEAPVIREQLRGQRPMQAGAQGVRGCLGLFYWDTAVSQCAWVTD